MATYRAPHRDPESWDSVIFTGKTLATVRLPPRKGIGVVTVSLPSAVKTDSKAAAGVSGAKVTRQGARDAKVTIVLEYAAQYFDEVTAAIDAIDPRGPSAGGPFRMSCPNLPAGFEAIQIEEIAPRGTAAVTRGKGRVTITGKETTFPTATSGGGVGGKGSSKSKLSDFERQTILNAIALLEQRIRTDAELLNSAKTAEDLQKGSDNLADLRRQVQALQKQLADGTAPSKSTSETKTPTEPGDPVGGTTTLYKNGKKPADPSSYKPGENSDAPKGGP